ncbi:hypothetical protein FCH28_24450 [Streptomyces piniterrae]|uniref:Uncharacterized protein n=1 Tax=Streptomyces piniterrae TaxID=2571125 RepID=A0A4U0NHW5_9ACTN|nr:hypothetical protein [Streptomyces piniterrae]TJZ49464.1 hypothetical protein FCH28_24450 [Streptomyces piniterrae]
MHGVGAVVPEGTSCADPGQALASIPKQTEQEFTESCSKPVQSADERTAWSASGVPQPLLRFRFLRASRSRGRRRGHTQRRLQLVFASRVGAARSALAGVSSASARARCEM